MPHRSTFDDLDVTQALHDHFLLGADWEKTKFFQRVAEAIEQGVKKWSCASVDEFRERLAGIDRLFVSIHQDGYRSQIDLEDGDPLDEIRAAIARDGRFLFVDGRHRLAIARLLRIPRVLCA